MIVRELGDGDASAVEEIYSLYWSGDFLKHLTKRLKGYLEHEPEIVQQQCKYFVAEEDGEVVGVGAFRNLPDHMKQYAKTSRPAEFYVGAVRHRGRGFGRELSLNMAENVKKLGYTEVLFFSAESRQDAWGFHDKFATRVSQAVAPNGEKGFVWSVDL